MLILLHFFLSQQNRQKGFTLLEILVAMLLVSMVTLIAAMALRLTVRAWERSVEEGDDHQLQTVLPALIEKQLNSLVKIDPFAPGRGKPLPFCGLEHAFSFFTQYAPQGSPWQGLLRVTYRFDDEQDTLFIYEQVITRKEDLNDEFHPLSDLWNRQLAPIGRAAGVKRFQLAYSNNIKILSEASENWKDTWECDSKSQPALLKMLLKTESGTNDRLWYFTVGMQGL